MAAAPCFTRAAGVIAAAKINPPSPCPHLTQRGARDYSAAKFPRANSVEALNIVAEKDDYLVDMLTDLGFVIPDQVAQAQQ